MRKGSGGQEELRETWATRLVLGRGSSLERSRLGQCTIYTHIAISLSAPLCFAISIWQDYKLKIKNGGNKEREFFPVMSLLIGLLSCFCHSYGFFSLGQSSVPPLSSLLLEGHWLWPREGSFLFMLLSFVINLFIFPATFWVSAATFSVFLQILLRQICCCER